MKVTIDPAGRITLDESVQQHLGLKPGDQVILEPHDGHCTLRPAEPKAGLRLEGNVLVHHGNGIVSADPVASLREDRWSTLTRSLRAGRLS